MALKRMFSLDFARARKHKTLLSSRFSFNFRHLLRIFIVILFRPPLPLFSEGELQEFIFILIFRPLQGTDNDYFFLGNGAKNIVIRLPSSLGICSTLPYSSRSVASRNNKISPWSL